jgi:Uma2 family endonuclease
MDTDVYLDELTQGVPAKNKRGEQLSFEELIAPQQDSSEEEVQPLPVEELPRPPAPVTGRHQDLRLYLTVLLKTYVEMRDAGLVRESPYRVVPQGGQPIEPDIVFIAHSHFDRVHETYMEGPPDIVIEVTSSETTALDRGEKFVLYESLGVREYWLIDPQREMVNFYHLGPDGQYGEFRTDMAGRYNSRVLKGFILDVDRLWKRVLPSTVEIVDMVHGMVTTR